MDSDVGTAPARWRRLDLFKVFCLLVVPLFLLVSYWTPFHGRYPTREELRDTPPLELVMNSPTDTPPEQLHTEIWIPIR